MGNGWDDLADDLAASKQEARSRNKFTPFDFSLEKGAKEKIVILRNDLFKRYEHEIFVPGKTPFSAQIPCLRRQEGDNCPLCTAFNLNPNRQSNLIQPRGLVGYTSILVLGDFTSKDGKKTYKNPLRSVRMKSQSLDTLLTIYEENDKDLVGLQITAKRSQGDQTPRIGDTWLPSGKRYTWDEILGLNPEVEEKLHNWNEVLPTWTRDEMQDIASKYGPSVQAYEEESERPAERSRKW